MASSLPTIVIVAGAWQQPDTYASLTKALVDTGYPAPIVPKLASCNNSDSSAGTCALDADVVRSAIVPLLDAGLDVIVLAHSYGGIPAGGAAKGLSKTAREKQGKKGGILGLIHLTAFVVPEDKTLISLMGGKNAPYVNEDDVSTE